MSNAEKTLDVMLIADDAYRVAMLRQCMRTSGLSCTIRRMGASKKASAYLNRRQPYEKIPMPDIVMFDLAEMDPQMIDILQDVAFGEQRSSVPVVLLTSPSSESLLESGEIDEGRATMFSPRSLPTFLQKLTGRRRRGFLRALRTLYEYGPILARQPAHFLERRGDALELQLSA